MNRKTFIIILFAAVLFSLGALVGSALTQRKMEIATASSFLAVGLASLALWIQNRDKLHAAKSAAVKEEFKSFKNLYLTSLKEFNLGHLMTVSPEQYRSVVELVRVSSERLSSREIAQCLLRERAFASTIMVSYEQAFYQASYGDDSPESVEFIKEVIEYFTRRVLRNPRLLWYWASDGGGLQVHYEPSTIQHYYEEVLGQPRKEVKLSTIADVREAGLWCDIDGPFRQKQASS